MHDGDRPSSWKWNIKKYNICQAKLSFPYEKVISPETLISTFNIPPKKDFYSALTEEHLSDSNYEEAKLFWKVFDCKHLLDYAMHYCHLDVILLAEIFENFRDEIFNWTSLDAGKT